MGVDGAGDVLGAGLEFQSHDQFGDHVGGSRAEDVDAHEAGQSTSIGTGPAPWLERLVGKSGVETGPGGSIRTNRTGLACLGPRHPQKTLRIGRGKIRL